MHEDQREVDLCVVETEELKDALTAVSRREDTQQYDDARTAVHEEKMELEDTRTVVGRREDTQQ